MLRLTSFLGLFVLMGLAWLLSSSKRRMNWRTIVAGVVLQFLLGVLILKTTPGAWLMEWARDAVDQVLSLSNEGAKFVFGEQFREHFFAFAVMPALIFMSSIAAVLYYFRILQKIVRVMAWIMVKLMDVSGAESLAASANVFLGQSEAALVIKPYIEKMTRSEIMALMVGGMANVSGGIIPAYVAYGADAGHLLASSVISAPASLLIAKILEPELGQPVTKGKIAADVEITDVNVFDAACRGASEGLQLALSIVAMLIAFVSLAALANYLLGFAPAFQGEPLTCERILGWLFTPLAYVMGVEWNDAPKVGALLGKKMFLNELIAYMDLNTVREQLSPRSVVIATYALCGFANFGSIAVQIGGIGALVPKQRPELARLGLRAMLGGTFSSCMTATVAGTLLGD